MRAKTRGLIYFIVGFSIVICNAQIAFENIPAQLGVSIPCGNTYLGNGITFFDYDNDGWDDLSIASSNGDPVHFLKNINGFFAYQTLNIELPQDHQSRQVNWVDIDNDGDNDLFITSDTHGNSLYENLGNMVMQDITASCGMLEEVFPYYGASWGDYNNDGFLDVFISIRDPQIPSILYKNNGNKTFTLVNSEAGLVNEGMMSFCSAFLDYDNDGDQDIYVSNDKTQWPNLLYRNNGNGTFTEIGEDSGTRIFIDAMSVTIDDVNADGWLDIYVTDDSDDSVLFINNTDGTFTDMALDYGVTFNNFGWGAIFLDADNDNDLDLYVSGETDGSLPQYESSMFYENRGELPFVPTNSAIPFDFSWSYSNAIGDIDNDGYTDFVVNNINHPNISVWKNQTPQDNNWLKVRLEGTVSNRNGVGSLIEISINGEKQYRYTLIGEGYLSQNSGTEIFGIGTASNIDYVKVKWLSGLEDTLYNVAANQTLTIVEASTLSVKELGLAKFSYYPNPVQSKLYVKAETEIEELTVFNVLGQRVMKQVSNSPDSDLDMSGLSTGKYYVKVKVAGFTETVGILKE